ncbi:MAG: hypothetical protein Q8P67_00135, partial [archaeon]|nr:hypothetical protein [archaeon]
MLLFPLYFFSLFKMNPEEYLSREAREREDNPFRGEILELLSRPGMLSLAGGLPSPSVFPYRSLRAELRTGEWVTADDEDGALSAALQYPVTPNPLLAMVTEHM